MSLPVPMEILCGFTYLTNQANLLDRWLPAGTGGSLLKPLGCRGDDEVGPPSVQVVSNSVSKDLLDVRVGKCLQSIGVIQPLFNIQVAPLTELHCDS